MAHATELGRCDASDERGACDADRGSVAASADDGQPRHDLAPAADGAPGRPAAGHRAPPRPRRGAAARAGDLDVERARRGARAGGGRRRRASCGSTASRSSSRRTRRSSRQELRLRIDGAAGGVPGRARAASRRANCGRGSPRMIASASWSGDTSRPASRLGDARRPGASHSCDAAVRSSGVDPVR